MKSYILIRLEICNHRTTYCATTTVH